MTIARMLVLSWLSHTLTPATRSRRQQRGLLQLHVTSENPTSSIPRRTSFSILVVSGMKLAVDLRLASMLRRLVVVLMLLWLYTKELVVIYHVLLLGKLKLVGAQQDFRRTTKSSLSDKRASSVHLSSILRCVIYCV